MPSYGGFSVPQDVWDAIALGSKFYDIPFGLLLAIAHFESGYDKNANVSDPSTKCPHGRSYGLFQLNDCGFAGNVTAAQRLDMTWNVDLACEEISRRYAASGSWFDAIQPWSTRYLAWPMWLALGDPKGGNEIPTTPQDPHTTPTNPLPPGASPGGGGGSGGGGTTPINFPFPDVPLPGLGDLAGVGQDIAETSLKLGLALMLVLLILFGVIKMTGAESTIRDAAKAAVVA